MSYLLQEDGVSRIILEDGSGFLLLEDGIPPVLSPTLRLRLRIHAVLFWGILVLSQLVV